MLEQMPWWQKCVIYQLFVRSFLDTNGNGEGDLQGVIRKLDYLQSLGIGAIWLSPMYPSPLLDSGYDVADFTAVDSRFGTLEDFDRLVAEAHGRGLKIILDWVPNHSSDQHAWFQESRSSRDNPKRDWYIWRDAKGDGSPPNNWISVFGGSVWEWDEHTGQYYCHTFLAQQPDLNWRNPEVREVMLGVLRFWLDRGVDGFRVDATCLLIKDAEFRDNPPNPDYQEGQPPDCKVLPQYTRDQPEVHEALAQVREVIDQYGDRLLAGELYLSAEKVVTFYGRERPELHLPLNLRLAWVDWNVAAVAEAIEDYERHITEARWPSWTLDTHDARRIVSRSNPAQARVAAMLLLTLRGTPTLYYGDEIGMHDAEIPPERAQDPQGTRIGRSRDPFRSPMQWDGGPQAGFTTGEPWLPVAHDYAAVNVAVQDGDPDSLLNLYRRLLALRREEPALLGAPYVPVARTDQLLAYRRDGFDRRLLVVLNFNSQPQSFDLAGQAEAGRILLSTAGDRRDQEVRGKLDLGPDEGVILAL